METYSSLENDLYKLYIIVNNVNSVFYIGCTKSSLRKRLNSHKYEAKAGGNTKLHTAMRELGIDNFNIKLLEQFKNKQECLFMEIDVITFCKQNALSIYNLADGGLGGFVVQDISSWKSKLSISRVGRKPSLGMEHTDDNKKLFSEVSKKYWDTQETYDPELILKYSYKQANELFGISKTHYYRLKNKQVKSNELN